MELHYDEAIALDRRYYSRIKLKLESILFVDCNEEIKDLTGIITDMSEGGIRLIIDKKQYKDSINIIKNGTIIQFQSYDEYMLYNEMKTEVISGKVEVIRIEEYDEYIQLGCKLTNRTKELASYIDNKKISEYIKKGFII